MTTENDQIDLTQLAKRRGFFLPSNQSYGGTAGFYTFGPRGAVLKRNLEEAWRERFVIQEGHFEIESPDVLPRSVLEACGHVDQFTDMLIECPTCEATLRADHLIEDQTDILEAESLSTEEAAERIADHDISCSDCGSSLAGELVTEFNLMFKTEIGPTGTHEGYLRPETAQGIFVEFPTLAEYARNQLPFGVAQIGSGYRNEISPRRGLVRTRQFQMAELQQFFDPDDPGPTDEQLVDRTISFYSIERQAEQGDYEELTPVEALECGLLESRWLAYYIGVTMEWFERVGIDLDRLRYRQHQPEERAHYANDCWDAEAKINGKWTEITGLAYRSDYDMQSHAEASGESYSVFTEYDEPKTVRRPKIDPDMSELGPEYGSLADPLVSKLETLVDTEPERFKNDTVTVTVEGEQVTVPVDRLNFQYTEETVNGEHTVPHVVEPSIGIGRVLYAILAHAHETDEVDGERRERLTLPPAVAPVSAGVFPLRSDPELEDRARAITDRLQNRGIPTTYDDSGSIGRRYRRQDEIGTPFCVTVDETPAEGDTVTIRERDSMEQVRVPVDEVTAIIERLLEGNTTVAALS